MITFSYVERGGLSTQETDRSDLPKMPTNSISNQQIANNVTTASLKSSNKFIGEGEVLRFDRVSRYDMGFYMCIASNGVSPSVSQRIFLPVSCKY